MKLTAAKVREVAEELEREVASVLIRIQDGAPHFPVTVKYHERHEFPHGKGFVSDFEIAIEDEGRAYWIVVECKRRGEYVPANELERFIQDVKRLRSDYPKVEIVPIFILRLDPGEEPGLKFNNIALVNHVQVYTSELFSQLRETIDAIGPEYALLEFLHLYSGLAIHFTPSRINRPCLRSQNFRVPLYTFLLDAETLLRIGYVNRAGINHPDLAAAYQRAIDGSRLTEIAAFVSKKTVLSSFPNNVVVNIETRPVFKPAAKDSDFGTISFPNAYGALTIIDGQHRLFSFAKIREKNLRERYFFVVTAYQQLSRADQAKLFYVINDNQVGIKADLIAFILAQLSEEDLGYAARVILSLEKEDVFDAPFKKGFKEERSPRPWLGLGNFASVLTQERLVLCDRQGRLQKRPRDTVTPARILGDYFRYLKDHYAKNWSERKTKHGFIQTNNGVMILSQVLRAIAEAQVRTPRDLDDLDESSFDRYFSHLPWQTLQRKGEDWRSAGNKKERKQVLEEIKTALRLA